MGEKFIRCDACAKRFNAEELSKPLLQAMRNNLGHAAAAKELKELKGRPQEIYAKRIDELKMTLAELEKFPREAGCPACGQGRLRIQRPVTDGDVEFVPELHLYHEDECETFYFPMPMSRNEAGALAIPCSGTAGGSHWSGGTKVVAPTDADYDFWVWVIKKQQEFQVLSSRKLDEVRERYEREKGGA